MEQLLVRPYRQQKEYTCGPASLRIVLNYYGKKLKEKRIVKIAHASRYEGTRQALMVLAFRKLGYKTIVRFPATVKDIESFVRKEVPVIVNYQAWGYGHYSVVVGFNNTHLLLLDPLKGARRKIRKDLFAKRWHGSQQGEKRRWMLAAF